MVKRGFYNFFWGIFGQIVTIALGIVVPRLVLTSFGSEINGLLNSITQIFAYFILIEAGIGLTTSQALYKPTADDDRDSINGILSATSRYYKKVAVIYFFAVLAFAIIYPFTVESSLPKSWVFMIIVLNGMGNVINFWVQGKYVLFLKSIGKNYINSNLATATNVLSSVSKIILLTAGCDVLTLQVVYFAISVIKMLYIYIYIRKNYSWINVKSEPNYSALSEKNSVLVHQITYLIFNNIDVLLITYFLGLKEVSVYSMYLMLFTYISTFATQIYSSFTFRLGQIYSSSIEIYKKYHDVFEVLYLTIVFIMFTMAYVFVVPFLELYTSGITDINYLDYKLAFLFLLSQLLASGRNTSLMVINFAGHFKGTAKQTVIEAIINLVCSLAFLYLFGIYGVLMGTVAALIYRMIDLVIYSNKKLLNRSSFMTFRRWLCNMAISFVVMFVCRKLDMHFDSYLTLIGAAIITGIVLVVIYFAINIMFEYKVFKDFVSIVKPYIKKLKLRKNQSI